MLDFAQTLYCAFDQGVPNRVGLILFGRNIDLKVPLDYYSTRQWFDKVEAVRATQSDPNPDNQACCTCCVSLHFSSIYLRVQLTFLDSTC